MPVWVRPRDPETPSPASEQDWDLPGEQFTVAVGPLPPLPDLLIPSALSPQPTVQDRRWQC